MSESASVWPAKEPGDKLDYGVDFEKGLSRLWLQGFSYSISTRVRPNKATGFEYECTVAGQSANREPKWPTTIGSTVTDGSVAWTCRVISNDGLVATLSGTPTWEADLGITVTGEMLIGHTAIAYIAGGTSGQDYSVLVSATCTDGSIRSKRCILPVRKATRVC